MPGNLDNLSEHGRAWQAIWAEVRQETGLNNRGLERMIKKEEHKNGIGHEVSGSRAPWDPFLRDALACSDPRLKNYLERVRRVSQHWDVADGRRRDLYPRPQDQPHRELDVVAIGALNYDAIDQLSLGVRRAQLHSERSSGESERRLKSFAEVEALMADIERRLRERARKNHEPFNLGRDEIFHYELGGSAFNATRVLAKAPYGLSVGYVGHAGQSPWGSATHLDWLREAGVDTEFVAKPSKKGDRGRGGCCVSQVTPSGKHEVDRVLATFPGVNELLFSYLVSRFWAVVDRCAAAKIVHATSLFDERTPAVLADLWQAISQQAGHRAILSFDPGHDWAGTQDQALRHEVDRIMSFSQLLFVNERELKLLAMTYADCHEEATPRQCADAILGQYNSLALVVIKYRGRTSIYRQDRKTLRPPHIALVKNAVDDTGAGDVFAGAFISELAKDAEVDLDTGALENAALRAMYIAKQSLLINGALPDNEIGQMFAIEPV